MDKVDTTNIEYAGYIRESNVQRPTSTTFVPTVQLTQKNLNEYVILPSKNTNSVNYSDLDPNYIIKQKMIGVPTTIIGTN